MRTPKTVKNFVLFVTSLPDTGIDLLTPIFVLRVYDISLYSLTPTS